MDLKTAETRARSVVLSQLEDLLVDTDIRLIKDEDRIIKDLHLTGDDASILAVLSARALGVKPDVRRWRKVETVGEAVRMLAEEMMRNEQSL